VGERAFREKLHEGNQLRVRKVFFTSGIHFLLRRKFSIWLPVEKAMLDASAFPAPLHCVNEELVVSRVVLQHLADLHFLLASKGRSGIGYMGSMCHMFPANARACRSSMWIVFRKDFPCFS
jgi:hypothetical protein